MDKELQLELFGQTSQLLIKKEIRIQKTFKNICKNINYSFLQRFRSAILYLNLTRAFLQYTYITRLLKKKVIYVEIKQLPFLKTLCMYLFQWHNGKKHCQKCTSLKKDHSIFSSCNFLHENKVVYIQFLVPQQ